MAKSNKPKPEPVSSFCFADLECRDLLQLECDGFTLELEVVKEGPHPNCLAAYIDSAPDGEAPNRTFQLELVGFVVDPHERLSGRFMGGQVNVGDGGDLVYFDGATMQQERLINFTIKRGGQRIAYSNNVS